MASEERDYLQLTSISVTGKMTAPLDIGAALQLSGSDRIATDGGEDRRVSDLRLGGDDAVRDVVVDRLAMRSGSAGGPPSSQFTQKRGDGKGFVGSKHGMGPRTHAVFLLLDLQDGAIFESPANDVRLRAGSPLDPFGFFEAGEPVSKLGELDVVPNVRKGCADDGAFQD